MRDFLLALLLASIALLAVALPGGAQAATVRVDPSFYKADHTGDRVVYQAEPGERDRIGADVEDLQGGSGPDRLEGGPGPNYLDGASGRGGLAGFARFRLPAAPGQDLSEPGAAA
jgi:hypothetical protein